MDKDIFLQRFGHLAQGPDGVKKLRDLILQLAVQGKLVEQVSSDEPANVLMEKIEAEKKILNAGKKGRNKKTPPPIDEEDLPYSIPKCWRWTRLDSLAEPKAGFAFKSRQFNEIGTGLPLIRIRDVGKPHSGTYFDGEFREEFLVSENNYLISMDGEFRVAPWHGPSALLNQRVSRLDFIGNFCAKRFVADALQFELRKLQGTKAYTTVDHLSGRQISETLIPLPPLAEQKRIVAKVDELMTLCDELEATQNTHQDLKRDCVASTLHHLSEATEKAEIESNWSILHNNFNTWFDDLETVKNLRASILQLAVQGKLVEQDAEDEPASVLLENIYIEKERLISNKEIKKPKPLENIDDTEKDHILPKNWAWERVGNVCSIITDGTHQTPKYTESGGVFVSAQNVKPFKFSLDGHRYVSNEDFEGYRKNRRPEFEDILLTRVGSNIGEAAVIDTDKEFAIYVSVALLKPFKDYIYPYFLATWLNSPLGTQKSIENTYGRGMSQGNLNLGLIRNFVIAIPPFSEQKRIVAKVEELMELCDQLEIQIRTSQNLNGDLLASLSHHMTAA